MRTNYEGEALSGAPDSCGAYTCHASTAVGRSVPVSGKHTVHLEEGFTCTTCHSGYIENVNHKNGTYDSETFAIIVNFSGSAEGAVWDNPSGTCSDVPCHGVSNAADWNSIAEGCTGCHVSGSSIDPLTTNGNGTAGKHTVHVESAGLECSNCHFEYNTRDTHINGTYGKSESDTVVSFGGQAEGAGVSAVYDGDTGKCDSVSCHGYSGNMNWYEDNTNVSGGGSTPIEELQSYSSCDKCHGEGSVNNPVTIDSSTGNNGQHSAHLGIKCKRCHDGYEDTATHNNLTLDQDDLSVALVIFDSHNPSGNWVSDTGPQTGGCSTTLCHAGNIPDWYDASPPVLTCSDCHKSAVSGRRQVVDSNGDGSGTGGDFNTESHHVIDYADRTNQIVQESDCLACHDQSNHTSGVVVLKNWDDTEQPVIFDPSDPSTLEPFCLGCHDFDGAGGNMTPFSSGNTLGSDAGYNEAGTRIESSWNKTYGHRQQGLTCVGNGSPGTGCHGNYSSGSINAHGSGNRGLLGNKYTLPVTSGTWDETNYSLCLDCHSGSPGVLSIEGLVGIGKGSNYAQHSQSYNIPGYNVEFMEGKFSDYRIPIHTSSDRQWNLHLYHLVDSFFSWSYRGQDSSYVSCVTCHNVHGVNRQSYYLWDEWNFFIENENGVEYGRLLTPPGWSSNANYPGYCSFGCHEDNKFRYPRNYQNEAYAVASVSTGTLVNGDTVTITFSNSTNAPVIDESNIDDALSLSGSHTWIDSNNPGLTAVWSSTNGHSNNVLTITIASNGDATGDPTIAVGDTIEFASPNDYTVKTYSIMDPFDNTFRGKMDLNGN